MEIREIAEKEKIEFNRVVTHPLQSYEWGEFRQATGIKVIRRGFYKNNKLIKAFTLTIHKIPHTPSTIGYFPKGDLPDTDVIHELIKIGKTEKCIFIQLEPNIIKKNVSKTNIVNYENENLNFIENCKLKIENLTITPAAHPLFTKYTFVLDLTKTEEELLKNMHSKARYNIKVAKKHGVEVTENNSDKAFENYLKLMSETTARQKFYAHTENYHRVLWKTLKCHPEFISGSSNDKMLKQVQHDKTGKETNKLTTHLLTAKYQDKILTAWMLFVFKDSLYYPYGASSSENREVMSSSLMMWEAIRFGKKLGLKKFDMWGALGPDPDPKDPWFGFHNFKQKYSPDHVEFIGSYDLIINPALYQLYKLTDKLRWIYLKFRK